MTRETTLDEQIQQTFKDERDILQHRKSLMEKRMLQMAEENFWLIYGKGHQYGGF